MDLNEPVFWDKNNKRLGRNSTILSSDLHQIWQLFTKLYSAVYVIESPSVREDAYCYVTKELGLDVMVSNPIPDAAHCKVEEDRQGGCGCAGGHA